MSRTRMMVCAALLSTLSVDAHAQNNFVGYLGQLLPVAFNFCPLLSLPADGRLLPIDKYIVLFSLIGTTYGGNGTSNFALPDLRGRVPIGQTVTVPAEWHKFGIPEAPFIGATGATNYQQIDLPPKSAESKPMNIVGAQYVAINWCIVTDVAGDGAHLSPGVVLPQRP